jgi:hypothetical protein
MISPQRTEMISPQRAQKALRGSREGKDGGKNVEKVR